MLKPEQKQFGLHLTDSVECFSSGADRFDSGILFKILNNPNNFLIAPSWINNDYCFLALSAS